MKVHFYREDNGDLPVHDFLNKIPKKIKGRILTFLDHIVDNDGDLTGVAFRKLHGYPLEEIRVKESKKLHRVIIKVRIKDSVIVLHGFTKKEGQKTPKKELEIAVNRYKYFMSKFK